MRLREDRLPAHSHTHSRVEPQATSCPCSETSTSMQGQGGHITAKVANSRTQEARLATSMQEGAKGGSLGHCGACALSRGDENCGPLVGRFYKVSRETRNLDI